MARHRDDREIVTIAPDEWTRRRWRGASAQLFAAHSCIERLYIEEYLTEPGLGAARGAAAIGIRERQLSQVFATDGVSIPRHILSRRLQLGYSMLSSTVAAAKIETVVDIAVQYSCRSVGTSPTPSAVLRSPSLRHPR
jgi:hypothetical protein